MREYFHTDAPELEYLNGQEIISKELANKETQELYGKEVYEITFESGRSLIAYTAEIFTEDEMKKNSYPMEKTNVNEDNPIQDKIADHIQMIEFTQLLGPYELTRVALFNDMKISEEKVRQLIESGRAEQSDNVVVISKQQYESLCSR